MKRILFTCSQLPWPLDNGQKIATFNNLTYLSSRFHIDVVSIIDPVNVSQQSLLLAALHERLPTIEWLPPLQQQILLGRSFMAKASNFVRSTAASLPYVVNKFSSQGYQDVVQTQLETGAYDALYVDSFLPSYVVRSLSPKTRESIRLIYHAHDLFFETVSGYASNLKQPFVRLAAQLDARSCYRYEKQLWHEADLILTVTRRLVSQIAAEDPSCTGKLLYFPVMVQPLPPQPDLSASAERVLYIGTVHFPPNLLGLKWFLSECWPQVLAHNPQATLDIVGRGGEELGAVHPSITIHNYVEDLASLYQAAQVCVVPLFAGSGVRLKILDALNHGVPVVSTDVGYAGLEIEKNRTLMVANDAPTFARHVSALLDDPALRFQVAQAGHRFLATNHGPQLAEPVLDEMQRLLAGRERSTAF
ncbi:MAG: glycosyltransferase family 4 protein [Herpetosiphon sp.]